MGLEDSLAIVQKIQESKTIVGILGFSQGARLAHLLAILHQNDPQKWLEHLKFCVLVAGYDKPIPPELMPYCGNNSSINDTPIELPSLHIWGSNDSLITKDEFEGLVTSYIDSETYVHSGKHHVPTKGSELPVYIDFVRKALQNSSASTPIPPKKVDPTPDEETAELQREEVQALEAIFPGALDLRSTRTCDQDGEEILGFPIVYRIALNDMEMDNDDEDDDVTDTKNWPKHPLTVEVKYPVHYPSDDPSLDESTTIPQFRLKSSTKPARNSTR